jgi:hypothetical protein
MMLMKRVALLIALNVVGGAAWAADLPLKAPAAPASYDWTGFYLGGNLGAANGTASFSDKLTPPSTFSSSNTASFTGGGQLGMNYEFRSGLVVGAEATFDWLSNMPTTFTASNLRAGTATGTINNRWITKRPVRSALRGTDCLPMAKPAALGSAGSTIHSLLVRRLPAFPSTPVAEAGPQARALNGLSQAIGPREPNMISSACRGRASPCPALRLRVLPATRSASIIAPSR